MRFHYHDLHQFTKTIFRKAGCTVEQSEIAAQVLISADLRGIDSHGLMRLPGYISLWEANRINMRPSMEILHQTPSTAVIDGDSGLGLIVGSEAMQVAVEKAKDVGTGWVSVRNSNHFGIAGYHAMIALEHDMIGIAMTNANPLVSPTFSTDRFLGTNPIAVVIPAGEEPAFVADFATTGIARGKLSMMAKKGEKVSPGLVQDKTGGVSEDPDILKKGGAILPLGGDREHGSHKGYCLGAIVDIFSAVFSGANFGPWVPPSVSYLPVLENSVGKGTGHFFGAMRIDAFQTKKEFKSKMDLWIRTFKNAKPAQNHENVMIPGEPERINEKINLEKGIPLLEKVKTELLELAAKFKIDFPKPL